MVMIRRYRSHNAAKIAFFANRLALLAGVLTPCPRIEYNEKTDKASINLGAFKGWQLKHIGSWAHAVKFSKDSILMRRNIIRGLLFADTIGLRNGIKDIYWSTDVSEFVFTNFDNPFEWVNPLYEKYLDECNPEWVRQEADAISSRIHTSRGLQMFGSSGFEEHLPKFLDALEESYVVNL